MSIVLSDSQRELQDRARSLTAALTAYEERCELGGGLTDPDRAEIRGLVLDHRLNAANMPAETGGQGLSILEQVIVEEQIGRLTNSLWALVWRPANSLLASDAAQRERYLLPAVAGTRRAAVAISEAGAGSDPGAMAATAAPTPGGYRIQGEKWYVTSGDVSDFLIVLARITPGGEPTLFLVDTDTPGVTITDEPKFMHTYVNGHPTFTFDVEVEETAVLGEIGEGYELTRAWFTEERLMIAARCIGAATRALELSTAHASERVQFDRPIIDNQMIQAMLADSAVDIALNRSFLYDVAHEVDQGAERKLVHAKAAMSKLAASEAAGRVVDRAVQIFGGRGYRRDFAVERLYRDVRVDRIWEGTSEIQRIIVANHLRKRGIDGLIAPPWG